MGSMQNKRRVGILGLVVGSLLAVPGAMAQTGACCTGDGTCLLSDDPGCAAIAGEFIGADTSCSNVVCEGACCLLDGTKGCFVSSRDGCAGAGGLYQGAQTTCDATCAALLGTSFTYQGQLKQDGLPLNGVIDLEFSLHPTVVTVNQIGTLYRLDAVSVVNGLFDVQVDFGANAFAGSARWLEVHVRTPSDPTDVAPFITLDPRQEITATPYATHAQAAQSAQTAQLATVALTSQRPFREEGANAVFEGENVGIGVATPISNLHVQGSLGLRVDDPTGAVVLIAKGTGAVGIGTATPTAKLNVESDANLIRGPVTQSDDIIVESADAVLGLYSDDVGPTGSAISLKEIGPQGRISDHWAMYQATVAGESVLRITHGIDKDYEANPTVVEISDTSVTLPKRSISAEEILDEPGIVRDFSSPSFPIGLDAADMTKRFKSQSIRCPAAGYVYAVGTAEIRSMLIPGVAPTTSFGLTVRGTPLPTKDAYRVTTVGAGAFATITVQKVFQCSAAGEIFIDLLASTNAVEGVTVVKSEMILMFFTTGY